ncbi:MAG: hypothetical protein Q4E28_01165 [Clostridia bacterium]|nr:hypothetical protein [Clostridia bacterium]
MCKDNRGNYTVESILTLTIFIVFFSVLLSFAYIIKTESIIQNAISQSAKEISMYLQIADQYVVLNTDVNGDERTDQLIGNIYEMSDLVQSDLNDIKNLNDIEGILEYSKKLSENKENYLSVSKSISEKYKNICDNPAATIKTLSLMSAKQISNETANLIIAPLICKNISKQYLNGAKSIDKYLIKQGIENGFDGIDFSMSNFLADQQSVNIVVSYKLKPFGIVSSKKTYNIRQAASTKAWVQTDDLSKLIENFSIWNLHNFQRGKIFVKKFKSNSEIVPVKEGQGIDGYKNKGDNIYLYEVFSINLFAETYSSFHDINSTENAKNYVLKTTEVKKHLIHLSNKFNKDIKQAKKITTADGQEINIEKVPSKIMVIYLPEEVQNNQGMLQQLKEIESEISNKKGVKIVWIYSQKALN